MKHGTILALALVVGGGIWYYKNSPAAKRSWVLNWVSSSAGGADVLAKFQSMTDSEIASVYDYVHNYINKGIHPAEGSALFNAIQAISTKYNVFT